MLDSGWYAAAICFLGLIGFVRILRGQSFGWLLLTLGAATAIFSAMTMGDPIGSTIAWIAGLSFAAIGVFAWLWRRAHPGK